MTKKHAARQKPRRAKHATVWKGNHRLQVHLTPISGLREDPDNARQHPEENLQAIKDSLQRFGQQKQTVHKEDGTMAAGSGTLRAAKALGWTHLASTPTDLAATEATAYGVADNRTAELATWDQATLVKHLDALRQSDVGLEGVGFSDEDVDRLLAEVGATGVVEDEVPEPPQESTTKPGDLWILGEHRVLCGDATKAEDYKRLLEGGSADLTVTDPPYGVSYGDKNRFLNAVGRPNRIETPIKGDNDGAEVAAEKLWGPAFRNIHDASRKGAAIYCFAPQGGDQMMMMMMKANFNPRLHQLIWVKNNHVLGRVDYAYKHEPIIYTYKPGAKHAWYGPFQTSVLEFNRQRVNDVHPTMKPVALIARLIENSTRKDETVLDPFLGSGTTLIAAEQLGRTCHGMDIEPRYIDVAVQRWENLTGRKATRAPA